MGRLAAELADVAVVTSDNPRSEEPGSIIREIVAGIEAAPGRRARWWRNRTARAAIEQAIGLAGPGTWC